MESWEIPSLSLYGGSSPRNQIPSKLFELKTGIHLLIMVRARTDHTVHAPPLSGHVTWVTAHLVLQQNQDPMEMFTDTSAHHLGPYGNYYQGRGPEPSLRRSYELLACFKKDMHKVRKKKKHDVNMITSS